MDNILTFQWLSFIIATALFLIQPIRIVFIFIKDRIGKKDGIGAIHVWHLVLSVLVYESLFLLWLIWFYVRN